ncbi:MAG: outer membrane protein assembly factor BamD [Fibrobacter sp.]|nr:outer membrane protein assembly factor BamD [Fibrobacter sp.]
MNKLFVGITCFAVIVTSVTAKSKEKKLTNCSERLTKAVTAYNEGKYTRVFNILESVKIQCNGSPLMDSMLYYLAMSEVKNKQYVEAKSDFEMLAQDFPNSPFYIEARFRIAQTVFLQSHPSNRDQVETSNAISLMQDFLEAYPNSAIADSARKCLSDCFEKLAQKDFNNARFYEKTREYESALIYYRAFIEQHPESKLVESAKFSIAELLFKLDRKDEAADVLQTIIESSQDQTVVANSKVLLSKIK